MREGWAETTLGEIALVNPEVTKGWPVDRQIRYVDISAVKWGLPIPTDIPSQPFGSAPGRARRVIRKGDVVLSTVRPNLRAMGIVPSMLDGEVASTGFTVLRDNEKVAAPGFVWCVVSHQAFTDDMVLKATGSNYPAIRPADVSGYHFMLPPLEEQRRIVDLIGAVDAAVEAATAVQDLARATLEAHLHALFSDPPATVPFEEAASFASGSAFPNNEQGDADGTIPFIKVSDMNILGNEIRIITANNRVTEEGLKRLKARTWPAGTVVFPKVGAALLTEKRRVLSEPTAFDNNIMGIIARDGVVTPDFLFAFMRSVRLGQFAQIGAVPSINQGHLKALSLPKLSMDEQRAIGAEMHALDSVAAAYSLAVERLRELRSNLLTALLSGEHEIPASYDELLEVNA